MLKNEILISEAEYFVGAVKERRIPWMMYVEQFDQIVEMLDYAKDDIRRIDHSEIDEKTLMRISKVNERIANIEALLSERLRQIMRSETRIIEYA